MFWIDYGKKNFRIFNKAILTIKLLLNRLLRIHNLSIFNLKTKIEQRMHEEC